MSLPTRIVVRTVLTIGLTWLLAAWLPQYIHIGGHPAASVILVGIVLSLLNLIVRPVLKIVTYPLWLFFGIVAITVANSVFLWLTLRIIGELDPEIVTLQILGGVIGWIVVSFVLGLWNWVLKEIL